MTDDQQRHTERIVGVDNIRLLSLQLFAIVKPKCIELSQLAVSSIQINDNDLVKISHNLQDINELLHKHYNDNRLDGPYQLTDTLADYIFFPITHLFKQKLENSIAKHVLGILGFLIRFSWSSNTDTKFIDQLYPIILYLGKGEKDIDGLIRPKDFEFQRAFVYCLSNLLNILPMDYFQSDVKRLSFLGDTTSQFLEVITSVQGGNSQEDIELMNDLLISMKGLYIKKVNADQLAHISPGIISKIVNITSVPNNLHYTIIVNILDILKEVIAKVFNDTDLNIDFDESFLASPNFDTLNELWEKQSTVEKIKLQKNINIEITVHPTPGIRSKEWLNTAAMNLKSTLVVLFKNILLRSNSKLKIQYKSDISISIVSFVEKISNQCFYCLFNVFNGLSIDVLALVLALVDDYDNSILESYANTICLDQMDTTNFERIKKLELISKNTHSKLNDLIEKAGSILFSTDEERISIYLMSIKFQFKILDLIGFNLGKKENIQLILNLKLKFLKLFQQELADGFIHSNQKVPLKSEVESFINNDENSNENKLDNIILPDYIDTKKIARFDNSKLADSKALYSTSLLMLSKTWEDSAKVLENNQPLSYLSGFHSQQIESKIMNLIEYLGELKSSAENSLQFFEDMLGDSNTAIGSPFSYLNRAFSLWISNHYLKSFTNRNKLTSKKFDVNEFLTFENSDDQSTTDEENDPIEEIQYLIMGKSQELIDELGDLINKPKELSKYISFDDHRVHEVAYSIAIDTIGVLSYEIPKEEFQSYFLMDYLYPLLESLTYQSSPLIQSHSLSTLQLVMNNYYNGSILSLIDDNADYLIDCLSLKLTVVGNLNPSLPGILLILLKVSGIKLLNTKQLDDIINEMFVLIDSYHGYSTLVEGFFIVFTELVSQVELEFLPNKRIIQQAELDMSTSRYKPWGLRTLGQLLDLIDTSKKVVDPYSDYSSEKEYFKRKPGVQFDQQVDSDDESGDESHDDVFSGADKEEENPWTSNIPKNIYFLVQKIFNYGFRLLLHPSLTLKIQILKALNKIYPLLCTDYTLLLPLITTNWPVIMTLISGTTSLSNENEGNSDLSPEAENLLIPSLEFLTRVINHDQKEGYLSSKFIETWDYLTLHTKLFYSHKLFQKRDSKSLVKVDKTLSRSLNPKLLSQYVKFILAGLNNYQRIIPDLTAYEMVEFCYKVGMPKDEQLGQDVRNILWVLENQK